jgi:ribosomal protein L7/L12
MAGASACPYCGVAFEGSPPGAAGLPANSNADPEILDLLRRGNKIEAIKIYRERYRPPGLKEAKDAVDEIERRMRGR